MWIVTMVYFIATPLTGMTYFFYTIATVFERKGSARKIMNTPLDTIKLDKSLIWPEMEKKEAAAMVISLAVMFHEMGLQVLAEGVENEEEAFISLKHAGRQME